MKQRTGLLAFCLTLTLALSGRGAGEEREAKKDEKKDTGPKVTTTRTEAGRESKIRVLLPAPDARLTFDNTPTKATGKERTFRSPALEDGKRYMYKVTATWNDEKGRECSHETKVVFRAGEDVLIDFRH